jgi:hypothetical protein
MLKGLAITPPVIGRISIGRMVEKNGKRLPEKDDQFTITSQMQHATAGCCIRSTNRCAKDDQRQAALDSRPVPVQRSRPEPACRVFAV